MAKLWQFSPGHPDPHFFKRSPKSCIFWKSANGGPRETFQKSPKKMPSLKRPKSALAQMEISSYLYALKVQRLDKILAHKAAPKVPEWPSYGNFRKVTQTRIFLKSAKGGPREIFRKSPKTGNDFGENNVSKSARMAKWWQFLEGHRQPAFSEKLQRLDQRNFSKNRPKGILRLKGQ